MELLREITAEYREQEQNMLFRHPWFSFYYNWLILFIVIAFAISCVLWAIDIHTERREVSAAATALAEYQAEEQAKAEARAAELAAAQMSEEAILDRWAEAGAKMLWGIRLFIDKYNYSQADLETYLRCPWNRYLSDGKLTDIEKIIFRDEQFTGAYRTNAAPDRYKAFARKMFEKFEAEEEPACDIKYVCAELTPKGIYLVPDPDSDGYVQRWHA